MDRLSEHVGAVRHHPSNKSDGELKLAQPSLMPKLLSRRTLSSVNASPDFGCMGIRN